MLLERLAGFRYSLFRLETLQVYRGSSEDEAFAAYRAGRSIPVTPELREWCARVHRRVSDGCAVQRVHVVTEPATEYIDFEVASYAPNVDAGEDVRIIRVAEGHPWPRTSRIRTSGWSTRPNCGSWPTRRMAPGSAWNTSATLVRSWPRATPVTNAGRELDRREGVRPACPHRWRATRAAGATAA